MKFEWDSKKNTSNKRKHKVSFEEASTCFYDPMHIVIPDPDHSFEDERFILLGCSLKQRLLVVVHGELDNDGFRIISARKADKRERRQYEEV